MSFPKAIITKPFLVSDQEYKDLGLGINLVGYDSFSQVLENTSMHASPRLLNYVEPYDFSGTKKTLFYTEINTNFQVGDRIYIMNGNYDSDSLIKKDKYKKGRDGYKVLKVDQCKVVLDIDYTGALPYIDDSFDDYIKVYYIGSEESFLSANRQVTTRGGSFDYKFNKHQNNIAFIERNLKGVDGWGMNSGVSGAPGFFVRNGSTGWTNITNELAYLGSFSEALSPTYKNNGRIAIMDASFSHGEMEFKEGFVYKWDDASLKWIADASFSPSIITKSNFRKGVFNGSFKNGLYGTQQKTIDWTGKGKWTGGTMVNTRWKSGTMDSNLGFATTYKAEFGESGAPFQKSHASNNGGFGYNFSYDSTIEKSLVNNGNFYNTTFLESGTTASAVENHILSVTQSFSNRITKAHFELCRFSNIQIDGGELKNSRVFNSKLSNVKSINSYFEKSVLKDSTYVSDNIIKILGYDEWNMSEYLSANSGTFSAIRDVNSKIYKFYISKESYRRMKSEDAFYIKGLKVKNNPTMLSFFDSKFKLTSWTEFYDDYSTNPKNITGVDPYSFYKRGFDCAAFLSTPEENAYIINSYEGLYDVLGATVSKYNTGLSGKNPNAGYSIDIIVSRHDIANKNQPMDSTSEWDALNPKDYNYSSDVVPGTVSLPASLGSNIDISAAYILDADFGSGIIETSDWNSGHHINYSNDVAITSVTSSGIYSLEIDPYNGYLMAKTGLNTDYPEKIGEYLLSEDDIVFLNSVDYDTRGMVTKATLLSAGSSYSATSSNIFLVNTKVSALTLSSAGTYYTSATALSTRSTSGNGTGLTVDIVTKSIGSVLGITYSAPISGGGSYSMNLTSAGNLKLNLLSNMNFDDINLSISTYSIVDQSFANGWKTTASDGKIEFWANGFNGVSSYSGNQFVELNANQPATLYQDFAAVPNDTVAISFAHRGRSGTDVMKVEIGPVGGPYTNLGQFSDGNTAWGFYTVNYTFPSLAGTYSLRFTSVSSTGNDPSFGNFLDAVSISNFLPSILTDDALGTVTGTPNATYSTFGPPMTSNPSGATGVGAIFLTGPISVATNGATSTPSSLGSGLTLNYKTSANGAITYLEVNATGTNYETGQVFKVEGGSATFSITSVTNGEIESISINGTGEDYLVGDVLDIIRPFDPNFNFGAGTTASVTVASITASSWDEKGLSLSITTGTGPLDGKITGITISTPGLYYSAGEIFAINGGNLDALVKIESVEGSLTRLNDTYKVIKNDRGLLSLKDLGTKDIITGLTAHGIFYTAGAMNRWGYISKTKIEKTKIKSGIFRRAYISNSLIRDIDYDSTDIDMANYDRAKNLLVSDTLFSNNSNILSSATYLYSSFVGGNDIWNDGIIHKSVINGLTFTKGTVRQSSWIDGTFTGGIFYNSKSFDAKPTETRPNFLSDRVRSYYMTGKTGATLSNNRYSWRGGKFSGGQFYKSDWESGVLDGGTLLYSKFYGGTINGGTIGAKSVGVADTRIYAATINYTTVENASVYSEDTSYTGLSGSSIEWKDGIFNGGIFGSNNDKILGSTSSSQLYSSAVSSLPIADYRIAVATQSVSSINPILGEFEISVKVSIEHSYLGDLIINLMAPNGKAINLKKRYSCSASDALISTLFTSDSTKPSIEIGTSPYSGNFKFEALLNQGAYYDLENKLLFGVEYQVEKNEIAPVIDYRSFPPTNIYEGDRYLVIATASDPNWTSSSSSTDWSQFVGMVVERNSVVSPSQPADGLIFSMMNENEIVFIKNKLEYITLLSGKLVKSYHSNTSSISELLNADKTISGVWKLLVMDTSSIDKGFVEEFELSFSYKSSYVINTLKNDAVWHDGIFNGGQFIDLGVWKNGKFNGGKFISTFGYEKSGSYLLPSIKSEEYSWQGGEFNGGEFGNESLLSNSTWFNGEFNGGVFKGKLWNNGIFTYGEFKGGSSLPAVGGGIRSEKAQAFIDAFKGDYYGVWRNGVVSDKKDNFIEDKKLFSTPTRAMSPSRLDKSAKFENMLWVAGTFDHPSGEIKNSAWLKGNFRMGVFKSSAFNPYVKRNSDKLEFIKDDSCIWENGKLIDSEFHISKWKYGHFISGTAVGMIWQDGIANYMNAHNIFWEKGVWRNGNWYGSNFDYKGQVEDGFAKEVLNRGIEWSGAPYCHVWNIFESDADSTQNIVTTHIADRTIDSFTTTNVEDAGNEIPRIGALDYEVLSATEIKAKFDITENGGVPIKEVGIIYTDSLTANLVIQVSGGTLKTTGNGQVTSTVISKVVTNATTFTEGNTLTGITASSVQITITGLDKAKTYRIRGYAINIVSNISGAGMTEIVYGVKSAQKNTITNVSLNPISNYTQVTPVTQNLWNQNGAYSSSSNNTISIEAGYTVDKTMPEPNLKGIVYSTSNNNNDPTINNNNGTGTVNPSGAGTFIATINTTANKTYYIKTYTTNSGGTSYSNLITVKSAVAAPDVTQQQPTTTLNGSLTSLQGSTSAAVGFIISIAQAPVTNPASIMTATPSLSTTWQQNTFLRIQNNASATAPFTFTKDINSIGLTSGSYNAYVYAEVSPTIYSYSSVRIFKIQPF